MWAVVVTFYLLFHLTVLLVVIYFNGTHKDIKCSVIIENLHNLILYCMCKKRKEFLVLLYLTSWKNTRSVLQDALTDFFHHLGPAKTSCEHNTDISSFRLIRQAYLQTVAYLCIQQLQSNVSIHLSFTCLCPPDKVNSNRNTPFSSVLYSGPLVVSEPKE